MNEVRDAVRILFEYAVIAIFAENVVFSRALGVSRLVQLVGDNRTNSLLFGLVLCVTQFLVVPLSWFAGNIITPLPYRAAIRPLTYVACLALVCGAEYLAIRYLKKEELRIQLGRIIPIASLNTCVLGTVLVSRTQAFTLTQSFGFALGGGLGYMLAVLLISEAQQRLRSPDIPAAFRGLPITLIYIGILALAIYGFMGHSVIV